MERIRNWFKEPQTANLRLFLVGMALLGVAGGISVAGAVGVAKNST